MSEIITRVPTAEELQSMYDTPDGGDTVPRPEALHQQQAFGHELIVLASKPEFITDSHVIGEEKLSERRYAFTKKLQESEDPADKNTSEIMDYLPITAGISIKGREIYVSRVLSHNGRSHAVGYTELQDGTVAPRLFYKSNSDGDWRVSPRLYVDQNDDGKESISYSKGESMNYGYVRETRLNDDLRAFLQSNEQTTYLADGQTMDWVIRHFTEDKLGKANTYGENEAIGIKMRTTADSTQFSFEPGHGFQDKNGRPAREVLAEATVYGAHTPAFSSEPLSVQQTQHSLLGNIVTEAYESNDSHLIWHLSRDKDGRVWVSGVTDKEDKPNTYGTDDEAILAGVYDNKPVEYVSQVQGLESGVDYQPTTQPGYVDITPLLDNLPVIKLYRQVRGIERVK